MPAHDRWLCPRGGSRRVTVWHAATAQSAAGIGGCNVFSYLAFVTGDSTVTHYVDS